MARKSVTSKSTRGNRVARKIPQVSFSNTYTSLLYGIITVFILFLIVVFGFRVLSNRDKAQVPQEGANTQVEQQATTDKYTVQSGETLWSISEKLYGTGYGWDEIAKANNLQAPYSIENGQSLNVPKKEDVKNELAVMTSPTTQPTVQATPTVKATATAVPTVAKATPTTVVTPTTVLKTTPVITKAPMQAVQNKIDGNTYTVVRGDTLWDISVRAYGDGFSWKRIADANKLTNPMIIHAGNKFTIPRP